MTVVTAALVASAVLPTLPLPADAAAKPKDQNGRWLYHAFNAKGVHVNRNLVRYGYGKAVLNKPNDRCER